MHKKDHRPGQRLGFTLIELLIVVAIIAILAAIAVPNFLEAQTRAKVSRVVSDLRTVATALEAYRVDDNNYPLNDGVYNVIPVSLTTPVSYLTYSELEDPFTNQEWHPVYGILARFYTYHKIVDQAGLIRDSLAGYPPPMEAVDTPAYNHGAFEKYGMWKLLSNGPDRVYSDPAFAGTDPILLGADILYDPTNGTNSWGNIIRSQRYSGGE